MQSTQFPPPSITADQFMFGDEESEPLFNEEEMISWLHYPLIDDHNLKSIFYDQLLYIPPQPLNIDQNSDASSQFIPFTPLDTTAAPINTAPPPIPARTPIPPRTEVDSFCGLFSSHAGKSEPDSSKSKSVGSESPVVGGGSVPAVAAASNGGGMEAVPSDGGGGGVDMKRADDRRRKGKEKEKDDSTIEFESSIDAKQQVRGSNSNKRTRTSEVHNLMERRRRDKINEKMKILKDLIPLKNKTNKVSLLDDAIIYLKSLQMQVGSPGGSNVAPTMYVPSMETNVSSPMMQYPNNMFTGPTFPRPAGDAPYAPAYAYPAFHMGHPSTIQAMNQSNHMQCLPGIMQNVNQPSFPISLEQYQQFLQMQIQIQMQMRMQMHMHMLAVSQAAAAANLSVTPQTALPQGTHNQQINPGYGNVDNRYPGNRAVDPRELFSRDLQLEDSKVNMRKKACR